MSNLSLKMWNLNAENQLKNNDGHKRLLLGAQIEESFQILFFLMQFYVGKYDKNWKSKNDLKNPLRALYKKLWAYWVWKFKILRSISVAEISFKKWWSQKTSPRGANWGKLKKKIIEKKGILGSKIWKKLKVQKWPQKLSTSS